MCAWRFFLFLVFLKSIRTDNAKILFFSLLLDAFLQWMYWSWSLCNYSAWWSDRTTWCKRDANSLFAFKRLTTKLCAIQLCQKKTSPVRSSAWWTRRNYYEANIYCVLHMKKLVSVWKKNQKHLFVLNLFHFCLHQNASTLSQNSNIQTDNHNFSHKALGLCCLFGCFVLYVYFQ